MLSIGAMATGSGSYYVGLAREDYYLEGGEPPGRWWGQGAQALGLSGEVERDAFLRVFEGFHPADDRALVQNAGDPDRQCGWDLTFSAPKSVSCTWAVADAPQRRKLQGAHDAAVKAALGWLQDECAFTRRGKDGRSIEPAGLTVAVFPHGTSRAQDCQLHSHALVINAGLRRDGTFGTVQSKPFYQAKMAAGALYRAELARQLAGLGYTVQRTGNTFEIEGVPAALVERFSTRRAEIEQALAERGQTSARAAAVAALDTRSVKEHVAREQLFRDWRGIAAEYGFTPEAARALRGPVRPLDLQAEVRAAVARAKERLSQEVSHFGKRDLLRRVAEEAQGRGIGAEHVRVAVEHELRQGDLVPLGDSRGEPRYTTRELFNIEKQLLADIDRMRLSHGHRVSERNLEKAIRQTETAETRKAREKDPKAEERRLSGEQLQALRHVTQGSGSVVTVTGMAGTGKTFFLSTAARAWEREERQIIGAALSGKAARGLQEGAGIESFTLKKLLDDLYPDLKGAVKHTLRQLGRAAGGKPTFDRSRIQLGPQSVVVVDEAGMVGTRQLARLVEACRKAGARLILVGDARQLQAVEVGGPFRSITERIGQVELNQIVRQQADRTDANPYWRRDAVRAFAEGRARDALGEFRKRGLLHVAENRSAAMRSLIEAWKDEGTARPEDHLILAGTRAETRDLNRLAQAARRAAGKLGHRQLAVAGETLHERDRVLFTRNNYQLNVRNGDLGTIRRVDPAGRRLEVRLDDGRDVTIPLDQYEHLGLGYAATTHKSQGATVRNAYVLAGNSAMTDRELTYVQASRARETTRFFTHRRLEWDPEQRRMADVTFDELAREMGQSRQKDLAMDVLAPARDRGPELIPVP